MLLTLMLTVCAVVAQEPAQDPAQDKAGFDPWIDTARYEIEYRAELADAPGSAKSVQLWLPLPRNSSSQEVLSIEVECAWPHRQTTDAHGNRYLYVERPPQEPGVAADPTAEDPAPPVIVRAVVERRPGGTTPPSSPVETAGSLDGDRLIPLDGAVSELALELGRDLTSDEARIAAYYDFVARNMRYSKEGEGWGRGDAEWACDSRYGNCTDFHSVLIGMARSQKIPARFTVGFPIAAGQPEGAVKGYHCWAELYDAERGWVPMDASEASKSGRYEQFFGRLPSDRIEFTLGRDLVLDPPQAGAPLNFFVYPYAEIDGAAVTTPVPWSLTYKRVQPGAESAERPRG
jgi:transglutaminase-like putative cysteine protease